MANALETEQCQFFSKWDLSCKWTFWGCGLQGIQCSPNRMILTEVYVLTHERLPRNNCKCSRNKGRSFFSKWDLSYKWVFWGCGFQGVQCSPNHMILAEVYVLTHERLPRNNDKCSRNKRRSVFLKMRFIMQVSFLRLWFSRYPVFSESPDSCRSLCFNTRAVVQKQRQML